jgi:hypothetical protein
MEAGNMSAQSNGPLRHLDPAAHEPGCLDNVEGTPWTDLHSTHVDLFCACHRFTEPKVLSNGTDVAWPAGWSEKQATDWRERHHLALPCLPQLETNR